MSAVVKTVTPFINKDFLLEALSAIECPFQLSGNEILTDRRDYYGLQKFVFLDGRYVFVHDSSAENLRFGPHYPWGNIDSKEYKTVSSFLNSVEKQYTAAYNRAMERLEKERQEQERIRIEQERKAFVEKQRDTVIQKAKEMGYSVKESRANGKIKLVLVRNTY